MASTNGFFGSGWGEIARSFSMAPRYLKRAGGAKLERWRQLACRMPVSALRSQSPGRLHGFAGCCFRRHRSPCALPYKGVVVGSSPMVGARHARLRAGPRATRPPAPAGKVLSLGAPRRPKRRSNGHDRPVLAEHAATARLGGTHVPFFVFPEPQQRRLNASNAPAGGSMPSNARLPTTGWRCFPRARARGYLQASAARAGGVPAHAYRGLERFHFFSVGCHWQLAASAA